tara:strand:+ start:232 stop:1065 length:834 start_codon:yes stop_codon:yes gene_type:complete
VCYPNFYEDYDSFIKRCNHESDTQTLNKNFRERRSMYLKEGLGDIPFLLNTERGMNVFIDFYTGKVEKELDDVYGSIALFIALNGINAAWELVNSTEGLKNVLREGYLETGSYIDDRYSNKYGGEPNPFISALVISIFLNRYSKVDLFKNRTQDIINRIILENDSLDDVVDKIKNHNNNPRARVISATELGIAQSSVELQAMLRIASQKPVSKYWVGVLDDRIRDSHFEATSFYTRSNAIPLNEFFNVNGSMMMHPRDFNAPAKEIVNCRCFLGYLV